MQGKIAKWWMPDDVAFVDEIPHTATGKIQKTALRERFKDYRLPTAAACRIATISLVVATAGYPSIDRHGCKPTVAAASGNGRLP